MNYFNFLGKRRFRYLLSILKGYKSLKHSNNLKKIHIFKKELTNVQLNISSERFDDFLYLNPQNLKNNELIFRQYILNKFLNSYFNRDILSYFGNKKLKKFYGSYPVEWLLYLSKKNIKINFFTSKIIWRFNIVKNFLLSIIFFIKIVKNTFSSNLNGWKNKDIIFIDSASISNQLIYDSINGYTFINSIQEYFNKKNNIKYSILIDQKGKIKNQIKLKNKKIILSKFKDSLFQRRKLLNLIFWFTKSSFICLVDVLFSRGMRAYLFKESIICKVFDLNSITNPIKIALFSCSEWIYRPAWTYLAELKGADIIFYFYSTNIFQLSNDNNESFKENIKYGWDSNSWSNYFVWNDYQSDFVKSLPNKSRISIVPPITFDNKLNKNLGFDLDSSRIIISIFDVNIFRNFLHSTEGFKIEYEVPDMAMKFIKDIINICNKKNIIIIYKSKRIKNKHFFHPKYNNFINNLSCKNFYRVSPEISLEHIVKISDGCISFPFTSPSVIAKMNNIPACFYDPSGELASNLYQTNDIELIKDSLNLELWIDSILKNKR